MKPPSGLVWLVMLALLSVAVSGRAADAVSPFVDGTLEQARAKAVRSQKKVLVAVWGNWSEDSRKLQWNFSENAALKTLVAGQTVAVQFDAIGAPEMTRILHIVALPAVVLLNGDGTEIDRWTGDVSAAELLRELPAALKGKTTLMRIRENVPATRVGRLRNTEKLLAGGSRQAALAELLWLYDETLGDKLIVSGLGGTLAAAEVIDAVAHLRANYPPADIALQARREKAQADLLKKPSDQGSAVKLALIDMRRADGAATLETWRKLPASSGRNVLAMAIVPYLVHERRYAEAARIYPVEKVTALMRDPDTAAMRLSKLVIEHAIVPGLSGDRADAAYAAIFFEAYAGAGLQDETKDAAAVVTEKGGTKAAPSLLRLAAGRAFGEKAEGLLLTLGIPPAPPVPAVIAEGDRKPLEVATVDLPLDSVSGGDKDAVSSTTDDLMRMSAVMVEGKPRGVIPISLRWRSNLTGKIFSQPAVTPLRPSIYRERFDPLRHGFKIGERLIAIDGEATAGMQNGRLKELCWDGDAGDEVKIVVQGMGADEAIFREVTVKRVAMPPKAK